jgi:hypothetical protein
LSISHTLHLFTTSPICNTKKQDSESELSQAHHFYPLLTFLIKKQARGLIFLAFCSKPLIHGMMNA